MKNKEKTAQKRSGFFKEVVSGPSGHISSKRVLGTIVLLICLACLIYLVISEGGTQVVENVMQTFIVVACALLGIGSVTNAAAEIFSKKKKIGDLTESDNSNEESDDVDEESDDKSHE